MVDNFMMLIILILLENQRMLYMFYLKERRIVACNIC